MADDDDRESNVNSRNYSRTDDIDNSRRSSTSSRDSDRYRGQRDGDRSRNDSSKHNRRRSRSRSGSREKTSSRSGRERNRRTERPRSDDDEEDEGTYGSNRKSGSNEQDEGKVQGRRDRKDEDRQNSDRITGQDWRSKLTSIRDAHFNRNKQAPVLVKNQFKNDGSFLEMFKRKMADQAAKGEDKASLTPNSLVLASSSIPFSPDLSLPPLTLYSAPLDASQLSSTSGGMYHPDEDVDGVPMPTTKSLPVPVSVGKRRLAKPLKTGIVHKKPQEPEEDEASQEKLDAWSRYLQEVQKYKAANCIDDDSSRPLVK